MLTGGVLSAVSVGKPSEEKEQTNKFAEDKQMVNEIDEETLEKARIALEDDNVRSRPDGVVYTPILESYEDAVHFLWRFNDGTTSTKFLPYREANEGSYHKGTLTVIYKNGSVENFNID